MPKLWNGEIKLIQTDDISTLQKVTFHMRMLDNLPLSEAPELMDNSSEDRCSQANNKMLSLSLYQAKIIKTWPLTLLSCLSFVVLGIEPKTLCMHLYLIFCNTRQINTYIRVCAFVHIISWGNKSTYKDQLCSVAETVLKGWWRNKNPETDLTIKGLKPKFFISTSILEV